MPGTADFEYFPNIPHAQEAVFAGRRSTDRLYLLLQNAFCAKALKGYAGTSSVYAVAQLDTALAAQGLAPQQRVEMLGECPACRGRWQQLRQFCHAEGTLELPERRHVLCDTNFDVTQIYVFCA